MLSIIWSDQMELMLKPGWVVEGLIPGGDDGCCGMLCGWEGSYKSFLALDLASHVALHGPTWLGGKVVSGGSVLYIVAERQSEVPKRLTAWRERYYEGNPFGGIGFCNHAVLLGNTGMVNELTDLIDREFPIPPKLIVIDTLAKCIPGLDENSAGDMGVVIANLDRVQHRYAATILLLHHRNARGDARGSSALSAHVSFEMHVAKKGNLASELSFPKMSVGEEPGKIRLRMKHLTTPYGDTLVVDSFALASERAGLEEEGGGAGEYCVKAVSINERVINYLRPIGRRLKPKEITEALKLKEGSVRSALKRLLDEERIVKDGDGRYRVKL